MEKRLHPFVLTELRKRAGCLGVAPWHLIQLCLVKHFGMEGMNIPFRPRTHGNSEPLSTRIQGGS